jgi:hypothetical protein
MPSINSRGARDRASGRASLHDREPHGLIVRMQLPAWQQLRLAA